MGSLSTAVHRLRGDERGTLSLEFVIITPMILLLFALVFLYGRKQQIDGTLDTGTRDAARAATLAGSYDQALAQARQIIAAEVGTHSSACETSVLQGDHIQVLGAFEPGGIITVKATCSYSTDDLGLPFNGSLNASSSFSSPLDPNKTVG